jgi:abequosyltransferase
MLVSLCIPTFNRAHTLRNLLKEVQEQLKDPALGSQVEIVIADNASTDDTETMVKQFIAQGLPVSYFRQASNLGFGKNLNKAVSLAKGKYCWLMGSDDLPVPGALATVLTCAAASPAVIVGNVLTNGKVRRFWSDGDAEIKIKTKADVELFIARCLEISSLFAFMSALVIRRDYWNDVQLTDDILSHPYTHQLRLFTAIAERGGDLKLIDHPIVTTGDEGNEWDAEVGRHFELDCHTLQLIATKIFNHDEGIFRALGKVFRSQYGTGKFVRSRACLGRSRWSLMVPVLREWGYPNTILQKKFYDLVVYWSYKFVKMAKLSLK